MYLRIENRSIWWLAATLIGLSVLMPAARADLTFEVATERELNDAIMAVNAGGAGTHSITFTTNIEQSSVVFSPVGNNVADEIIIDGAGYALTGNGSSTVLRFKGKGTIATLRDISITGGYASSGGGLSCDDATLTIENARIAENGADSGGGLWSQGCDLNLVHTTFENNSADPGGGIWFGPGKLNGNVLSATDSAFRGNSGSTGGAVYAAPCKSGQVTLMVFTDSAIEENSAWVGGGLYCGAGATQTRLENSQVRSNNATSWGGGGGGIFADKGCHLELTGTTVSGNSSHKNSSGGGIYSNGANVLVSASTVSDNSAERNGGGLYNYQGDVRIINSTFSRNSALDGGAIDNSNSLRMEYSTIAENNAKTGGIRSDGKATALASLLTDNLGSNCRGKVISLGYNLSSDGSCLFNATGDIQNGDAALEPLADNGGPTLTHALGAWSEALDRVGDGKLCGVPETDYAVDQRGVPRPQNKKCDTGAYEVIPNNNPICDAAYARPRLLWPPNHKFEAIEILGVTDPDGDPVTISVWQTLQDEPVDSEGDGSFMPDAIIADGSAEIRAERMGGSDGRVYEVSFTASDGQGGQCDGAVDLSVPHDRKNEPIAGEDWYDSTLAW
ncbi:right-handed parallel beta-helix repeat-containing protein [Thiocapsa marina]|uniref:Right handed beta helix domain-containing protein n=1 Tax=Thiocapsa marina 5811 TaxID=768671 RepID=F9U838_9GAMM|nr:right-handed parallel beta-helix repeat-containing protein [Thiocapsa marina]EGV19818.1 hypothetical protein ThimaDRAFT_1264 [Thiocapsa marina 5811]